MGIKVGIPVLKLSKGAKATKRKGDAKKVVCEGLGERYSKDKDLDEKRSHLNKYTGFTKGEDLYKYWEKEASAHLDAKGRNLRSDAVIGYTLIIKPDIKSMKGMTESQRLKFLDDSMNVISDLLNEHGLQVDATALHMDEVNEHIHVFGHDTEYKAGKKIDIRLYGTFNREYPKRMRSLGYDVENLTVYDVDKTKDMTKEEKEEYKSDIIRRKKEKKKSGRSSNKFKEDKIKEQEELLQKKEQELQARESSLRAREDDFAGQVEIFQDKQKEWEKEANMKLEEAIQKAVKESVERLNEDYKREVDKSIKECEEAKRKYEAAARSAALVKQELTVNSLESYNNSLRTSIRKACERTRYTSGKTLWDIAGKSILFALSDAVLIEQSKTTPDVLRRSKENAEKAETALKTVQKRRILTNYGNDVKNDDFSL